MPDLLPRRALLAISTLMALTSRAKVTADATPANADVFAPSPGVRKVAPMVLSTSGIDIRGLGWALGNTPSDRAPMTLLKAANGVQLTLSGSYARAERIHLDGDRAAGRTGAGLRLSGERPAIEDLSVVNQGGDGLVIGGAEPFNKLNVNLWRAIHPVLRFNSGRGCYIAHTGAAPSKLFPHGLPNVNAGLMASADIARNEAEGLVLENTIDNVFINTVVQDNGGRGVVLRRGARGQNFFGLYAEANNGGQGSPGDEIDLEKGATENLIIGLRVGQLSGSGLRDANSAGENYVLAYDRGIGAWAQRGKHVIWNAGDDQAGADLEFYKGVRQDNIVSIRNTRDGASGGRHAVHIRPDGDKLVLRWDIDSSGLARLQNSIGGLLIGKATADTKSSGIQIGDSGSGKNTRINMVGSGAAADIKLAFYNRTGLVGSITTSGTATAFSTSSDRRLKAAITPAPPQGAILDAIRIVEYEFKAAPGKRIVGVIADELQKIVPDAVTGEPEAIGLDGEISPQGVDYSKLVPVLISELQSLRARVAALEAAQAPS